MKNFPKHLNSRFDYEYIRANFPAEQWRPEWEKLAEGRFIWTDVIELPDSADGENSDTRRVIEVPPSPGSDEPPVRLQQELRENPYAAIFRYGFTIEEVEDALSQ